MAAQPYRSTCTIDGTKFDAVESSVVFETAKDRAGMPQMGSLRTTIYVVVDFHDDKNMPYATMSKLFGLANVVTRDKLKDMKIEFWKDDSHQDALACYKFKGWISSFKTCNPAGGDTSATTTKAPPLNHMLILYLEPVMNQQNFQEIALSN
jgi:hypothetical protein